MTPPPRPEQPTDATLASRIAAAVTSIDGLTLQVPLREHAARWAGRDEALAITMQPPPTGHSDSGPPAATEPRSIEIRMVAHRLPLPVLLDQAAAAVRATLLGTGWADARLRLVVTALTRSALLWASLPPTGDPASYPEDTGSPRSSPRRSPPTQ